MWLVGWDWSALVAQMATSAKEALTARFALPGWCWSDDMLVSKDTRHFYRWRVEAALATDGKGRRICPFGIGGASVRRGLRTRLS